MIMMVQEPMNGLLDGVSAFFVFSVAESSENSNNNNNNNNNNNRIPRSTTTPAPHHPLHPGRALHFAATHKRPRDIIIIDAGLVTGPRLAPRLCTVFVLGSERVACEQAPK